ncbi:hypothetical protein SISSUDRAFT_968504, partial [Sistotremastrum suecicum HHB10207 ss-3]
PPGSSFLGSRAVQTDCYVLTYGQNSTPVMIDSGSDITLISEAAYKKISKDVKTKQGFRISLFEVTGKSKVTGFVTIPLYFDTPDGPVTLTVEAYVVKGMSTPLLIGNDYQDQYSLTIRRSEGETHLEFADTGRSIHIQNSTSTGPMDEEGKPIKIISKVQSSSLRTHRDAQRRKRKEKARSTETDVRALQKTAIKPGFCKKVPVKVNLKGRKEAYVEPIL